MVFSAVLLLTFIVSIFDLAKGALSPWLDMVLLLFSGAVGMFLVLLWWISHHTNAINNFNLLWALPTNLFTGVLVFRPLNWVLSYYFATAVFLLLVLIFIDSLSIQTINVAFLPLILSFLLRYGCYISFNKEMSQKSKSIQRRRPTTDLDDTYKSISKLPGETCSNH